MEFDGKNLVLLVYLVPCVFDLCLYRFSLINEYCFVALRGAATLKARTLKEVWNIAAVIPVEKGMASGNGGGSNGSSSGELIPEENFLGICSRELLARGGELLKRTRKGTNSIRLIGRFKIQNDD